MGLTGGIGVGKSTALDALEHLGAGVLSTDRVVHELYESDDVRSLSPERFLEETLWPRVGARMAQWREEQERLSPPPRVAVVEVPLLFESGMEQAFDATIAIVADEQVRRDRASARDHRSLDERTARQLSQEEKATRATYVVANNGTVEQLERALSSVLDNLQQ
ncbi:MAG: dephospho-CoA kinase [Actinobacteria bacterium]|nr:MAG: dephospho-CoA kinase [Actinomycetota bacterium]